MSERRPNPEREPKIPKLRDDCSHCDKTYKITNKNSAYYSYSEMPDANHIVCKCPHCKFVSRIFLPNDSETRDAIAPNKIPVVIRKTPGVEIMETYLQLYDIDLIKENEVTPRQENVIRFARYLLDNDLITVEELWDNTKDLYLK